jgi:hypothetical protein
VKMALMAVNNHNEQGKDYRSQPRWSLAGLPIRHHRVSASRSLTERSAC